MAGVGRSMRAGERFSDGAEGGLETLLAMAEGFNRARKRQRLQSARSQCRNRVVLAHAAIGSPLHALGRLRVPRMGGAIAGGERESGNATLAQADRSRECDWSKQNDHEESGSAENPRLRTHSQS